MRIVRFRLGMALLFVAFSVLFALPARSQGYPDIPDLGQGLNAQDTYQTSDFDNVDMATGRVTWHIPLVEDHSQRGLLNFTYSLMGTNTSSWYEWNDGMGHTYMYPVGFTTLFPAVDGLVDNYTVACGDDACDEWETYATGMDGSNHVLGQIGMDTCCWNSTPQESIDGTGINWTYTDGQNILTQKNGVQYSFGESTTITDPNGNQISGAPFSTVTSDWTDTLGRTWSFASIDGSVCPNPYETYIYAYAFTVPGPEDTTRTYTLCYSADVPTSTTDLPVTYEGSSGSTPLTAVLLPDGTSWTFSYDSWGDMQQVNFPTGGYVYYTWQTISGEPVGPGSCNYNFRILSSRGSCPAFS